jgi:hypothetical protein
MIMKVSIVWDVTSCCLVECYQRLGRYLQPQFSGYTEDSPTLNMEVAGSSDAFCDRAARLRTQDRHWYIDMIIRHPDMAGSGSCCHSIGSRYCCLGRSRRMQLRISFGLVYHVLVANLLSHERGWTLFKRDNLARAYDTSVGCTGVTRSAIQNSHRLIKINSPIVTSTWGGGEVRADPIRNLCLN